MTVECDGSSYLKNLDGRFLPCGPLGLGKLEVRELKPLVRVGCKGKEHYHLLPSNQNLKIGHGVEVTSRMSS